MKKTVFSIVVGLCLFCIVLTVLIYLAPRLGWSVSTVSSGSMEPAIKTGAMVITNPVNPYDIEVGNIILYRPAYSMNNFIVHRVIAIKEDSLFRFVTQGDANLTPDPYDVHIDNVIGRVCINISGFGGFIGFVRSTAGFFSLVVGPSVILLAAYIFTVWRVLNENAKKKADTGS